MKKIAIPILILAITLTTVACVTQSVLATLITTLGNASASIAALEGNATLATTLKADTAAASSAVLNWQKGSASTMVIEALNIVEADLNLIPYVAPYSALIDIGIATVDEIITIVTKAAPPAASSMKSITPGRHVKLTGKVPHNRKHFVSTWNTVAASDPKLTTLVIK